MHGTGLLTLAFNRFLIDWMGSAVLMSCGAVVGTCFSIYFQYCYLMVPYILAENPDMKAREALRLSKEMMDGQKWNAFVLGLSFYRMAAPRHVALRYRHLLRSAVC